MKSLINYLLAGIMVAVLLGSSALGVPPAARINSTNGATTAAFVEAFHTSARPAVRTAMEASAASVDRSANEPEDISIDLRTGDDHIALKRKHRRPRCCLVVISIIGVLVGKPGGDGGPSMIDLDATITGADASEGSLLYSLAWLARNPDPLRSVLALGYDIQVIKQQGHSCTGGRSDSDCVERARRFATLIDATLALGSAEELARFRQDASALGIAPDCVPNNTEAASAAFSAASPDQSGDLSIDASLGDAEITFERSRGKQVYLIFKLKEVIVTSVHPGPPADAVLHVSIEGAGARAGSLPYTLAWLAGDPDPLGSVRALGYDITVNNQRVHSCADQIRGFTCEDAAHRLASLLDAALAFGSSEERAQFRRDASAIGLAPACVQRER